MPGPEFWFSLKRLSVLHLHDNGLSKLEELRHISHAPSLLSLTLYDTPMSLKKTYRHCAVNAIWTLKALDQFVVSDEEIIEDADFPLKCKPMQPHLHFRWNFSTGKRVRTFLELEIWALLSFFIKNVNLRLRLQCCYFWVTLVGV